MDAERLYQLAKLRDPKLNRVTVYRTLKLLKQGGLVDELDLMHYGGDQHYYETRMKHEQGHAISPRGGQVEEVFRPPPPRLAPPNASHIALSNLFSLKQECGL